MATGTIKNTECYKAGDVIDLSGFYLFAVGYGQSATMVQCTYTLPKKVSGLSISTTCSIAWLRGAGGQLAGTIAAIGVTGENQISIAVSTTGATLYGIYIVPFGNGTITFS